MEDKFKKRENESDLSYMARIYRSKIELGMTNKQLNELINSELGTDYAEPTTRGKADIWNKCLEEQLENNSPESKMDEIRQAIGELEVKEQLVRNKTNKMNKIKRDFVKSIEISNDIKECLMKHTEMPTIDGERIEMPTKNKLIVQCGDWHIGYTIKGYKGNYYSYDIAKKRLGRLKEEIRNMCKIYNINEITLVNCGDIIENTYMRRNQSYECEFDMSEQIALAGQLLYQFATELSQLDDGKNVDIVSIGGNHSRMNDKDANIEGDNANVIIVKNLHFYKELSGNEKIKILDVDFRDDSAIFEVNGMNFKAIHGDNRPREKKKLYDSETTMDSQIYKIIFRGHDHNFNIMSQNSGGYVITCGSLFGYNPYSVKNMGCTTNASQTLVVVGEKDIEAIKDVSLQIC